MNLKDTFKDKKEILGIYFSAGYPYLEATEDIVLSLQENGADFIEIGMPYSDPLADGPVIESCHQEALKNGMNLSILFEQLRKMKDKVEIPLLLMGYYNPVFKYGIEKFCDKCAESGVGSVILPDMPVELYADKLHEMFKSRGLQAVFLATPITPEPRLELIDKYSEPFVYLVSSSSTTGKTSGMQQEQLDSFKKIKARMSKPVFVGFGISKNEDYRQVVNTVDGAIVGSAFIRAIEGAGEKESLDKKIKTFIQDLRGNK